MFAFTRQQGGRPHRVLTKGVGPSTTSAWPGWNQPDIPVEVDTVRLETSRTVAGILKKFSLAGIAKLSRLKYTLLICAWSLSNIKIHLGQRKLSLRNMYLILRSKYFL
jgi:hypothetical protein